jgi:hypothetical protein
MPGRYTAPQVHQGMSMSRGLGGARPSASEVPCMRREVEVRPPVSSISGKILEDVDGLFLSMDHIIIAVLMDYVIVIFLVDHVTITVTGVHGELQERGYYWYQIRKKRNDLGF